jgi:hypothetical protein
MTISAAADGLFIDNQIGKTATPSPTGRQATSGRRADRVRESAATSSSRLARGQK